MHNPRWSKRHAPATSIPSRPPLAWDDYYNRDYCLGKPNLPGLFCKWHRESEMKTLPGQLNRNRFISCSRSSAAHPLIPGSKPHVQSQRGGCLDSTAQGPHQQVINRTGIYPQPLFMYKKLRQMLLLLFHDPHLCMTTTVCLHTYIHTHTHRDMYSEKNHPKPLLILENQARQNKKYNNEN